MIGNLYDSFYLSLIIISPLGQFKTLKLFYTLIKYIFNYLSIRSIIFLRLSYYNLITFGKNK